MSDLLISSDAWQRLNEAATSVAASVDKHYGSHAAGVSKGWDDALAAVGRNLHPAALSQPSGEVGLPEGWRVEPMDAPADRLLVTSREGAAVVIGPDSWKQTLGSHVLYSLIRDLSAAPPQEAKGEAVSHALNTSGVVAHESGKGESQAADARGGEVWLLDSLIEAWSADGCDLAPFECAEQLHQAAALIRQLSAAGPDVLHPQYEAGFKAGMAFQSEHFAAPVAVTDVLTYRNQPNNVGAWGIGEACSKAKPGGDFIDHGLSLLQQLEAKGYGIVQLPAALSAAAHQEGQS